MHTSTIPTREQALADVQKMSTLLASPDTLLATVSSHPEYGPSYNAAIRRALLASVDLNAPDPAIPLVYDETAKQLVDSVHTANEMVLKTLLDVLANAGRSMAALSMSDLMTSEDTLDPEVIGPQALMASPADVLQGTFSWLVAALGSEDAVSQGQFELLNSLPAALRPGTIGFSMSLTGLVVKAFSGHQVNAGGMTISPIAVTELISNAAQLVSLPSVVPPVGSIEDLIGAVFSTAKDTILNVASGKEEEECGCERCTAEAAAPDMVMPTDKFVYEAPKTVQ